MQYRYAVEGNILGTVTQCFSPMLSKKVHVRAYTVKAHERVIRTRIYKFICEKCDQVTTRESYGPMPMYCESCRPPAAKTKVVKKKKKPRPVGVRTAKAHQEQSSRAAGE